MDPFLILIFQLEVISLECFFLFINVIPHIIKNLET